MILIVGGRSQGKRRFAESLAKRGESVPASGKMVGADADALNPDLDLEEAFHAGTVCHPELYIRQCMMEKRDPARWIDRLCRENPAAVVIADEIGCGIVPVDAFEREYRETAGRLIQRLAAESGAVYRVVCGIGNRIK